MQIEQIYWNEREELEVLKEGHFVAGPQMVLFFCASGKIQNEQLYRQLQERYPHAHMIGCSSAGEIIEQDVFDNTWVATAIEFEKTPIKVASISIAELQSSYQAGLQLGNELKTDDLKGVFVISEGLKVNGSELVQGLTDAVGTEIPIAGGLAGDGPDFGETRVCCNNLPVSGQVAVLGLYGESIQIGCGSVGGWDAFGPERVVTRAEGNILYELDGKPALQLYKTYLGDEAKNLPGSALLFPLMIRTNKSDKESGVVRTILGIDEENQSMTFAGDIKEGAMVQLMSANFERLIDGAGSAARFADLSNYEGDKLAILISCVGRKMILGQRIADEVETVQEILGDDVAQIGFYSYGEISPHVKTGNCELHNQTMTVTMICEN